MAFSAITPIIEQIYSLVNSPQYDILRYTGHMEKSKMQSQRPRWVHYAAAVGLILLYYAASATGTDYLAMLIILPVGYWIIWNLTPEEDRPVI